jgi:hypothetical protein
LLLLGWLAAAVMASPRFDTNWSRLPAGTEIPELRTSTSRTYSNGDGTFTADITPILSGVSDSRDSSGPTSTGWIEYYNEGSFWYYAKNTPNLHYFSGENHCGVAYAKFDLTPIPDSGAIVDAQLCCYQYEINRPPPLRTHCTYSPYFDPDTASDDDIFHRFRYGWYLASIRYDSIGWVTYDISHDWFTYLEAHLLRNWVAVGIRADSGAGTAYGCGPVRQPYLRVSYIAPDEPDIQALNAELLTYPIIAGRSDTALLTIANEGRHASAKFWAFSSLGLTRDSTPVQPIAVGETSAVRVALPSSTAQDTMLDYRLWTSEQTDGIRYNDSARLRCWSFPTSTYLAEGFNDSEFPPGGWVVADSDGGTHCWMRQAGASGSHSGTGFASCAGESTGTSDDWLVGGSICPDGGYPDSVGFFIRNDLPLITYSLEVWALRARHAPAMLLSLSLGDTVYSRHSVSLDTFDGDTIEVAFRHRSWGDWRGLYLDDIWFSGAPASDTSDPHRDPVQRREQQLPVLAFAPNPAGGRVVTVRSAIAVGSRRRLTIRNVLGGVVQTFVLDPSGITRLDLRDLAPGVYMATLDGTMPLVTRKLVLAVR